MILSEEFGDGDYLVGYDLNHLLVGIPDQLPMQAHKKPIIIS